MRSACFDFTVYGFKLLAYFFDASSLSWLLLSQKLSFFGVAVEVRGPNPFLI